ncbi:MAG TPA: mechanosensitive ion channel family protein [Candidatus Syntrophosphaera sp.]|nr:mechanosensitive ion channel family protein [Candidatus Syntrophosphaera sp.]
MNITALINQYITPERLNVALRVVITLAIGIPLLILIKKVAKRLVANRLSPQSEQLVVRAVYYISVLILTINVLNEFGFKLSALLGAAGVVGIAVGFASQTSVSNIISGIFLISEKPFVVGDVIEVSGQIGTVESIDLLSLKLKTPDNRFVRVPNETMIKSEVINITRFPQRRVNINVGVAYKEDLHRVREILAGVAAAEPLALKDPQPVIVADKFGDSSIDFLFGVWGQTEDYWDLKTSLMIRIRDAFAEHNIEIPYPHISLYAGETSQPINNLHEGSVKT